MRNLNRAFWGFLILLALLWWLAEPSALQPAGLFPFRATMVQFTGVLAIGCMSLAMLLALRPRWPERWFGGLDKMYRFHKWLGIAALAIGATHWLWAKVPPWAVSMGWIERAGGGGRPAPGGPAEAFIAGWRSEAVSAGEWAFYGLAILIALALIPAISYRLFAKTHRVIAIAFLALAFHAAVLIRFRHWTMPVGWVTALLLAAGVAAAVIALLGFVGAGRRVKGSIAALTYYPGIRAIETTIAVPENWPGHKAGQFAFKITFGAALRRDFAARGFPVESRFHQELFSMR